MGICLKLDKVIMASRSEKICHFYYNSNFNDCVAFYFCIDIPLLILSNPKVEINNIIMENLKFIKYCIFKRGRASAFQKI